MLDGIKREKMTGDLIKNSETKELLESIQNLDDPDLYSKVSQGIKNISSHEEILEFELKPISLFLKEASEPIISYKLLDASNFKALDDSKSKILRNGLITIGAIAGVGKTSFVTHLVVDIMKANESKEGEKTCFILFSLDDSRSLCIKRVFSQFKGKSYLEDKQSALMVEENEPYFTDNIFIYEEINHTTDNIKSAIYKAKKTYKNVIICVDYLQIIKNIDGGNDIRTALNNTLKIIKGIQKDTDSMIILLSQLNRETSETGFKFRETSEVENVSDVCIEIIELKEEATNNNSKEKNTQPTQNYDKYQQEIKTTKRLIKVVKNKIGLKGQCYLTEIDECLMFQKLIPINGSKNSNSPITLPSSGKVVHPPKISWGSS